MTRRTAWLVAAQLGLGVAWSAAVPMFEKPDEPGHLAYVTFLVRHHRLPGRIAGPRLVECAWEFHHPPLYYALTAALLRVAAPELDAALDPGRLEARMILDRAYAARVRADGRWPRPNAASRTFGGRSPAMFERDPRDRWPWQYPYTVARGLRLAGLLWGAILVIAAHGFARAVLGPGVWADVAAAVVALSPQAGFIVSGIGNEGMAAMWAGLTTWLAWGFVRGDRSGRRIAAVGACLGLGLLTKVTVGSLGLWVLACGWAGGRWRGLAAAGLATGGAALVSGWWFARNAVVFGDPLAWQACLAVQQPFLDPHALTSAYFWSWTESSFPVRLFRSFWGTFGWMTLRSEDSFYRGYLVLTVTAVAAVIVRAAAPRGPDRRDRRRADALLVLHLLATLAMVVQLNRSFTGPQGRYLFPSLLPVAVLIAAGVREGVERLTGRRPAPRLTTAVAAGSVLAWLAWSNIAALRRVLAAYAA